MQGAWLAPGSASATLALASEEFNDMKCTRYQLNYEEAAPRYFYFDCVGFTGYTLEQADPRAWASLRRAVEFQAGQVTPTPLEFVDFFKGLRPTPRRTGLPTPRLRRSNLATSWPGSPWHRESATL